MIDVVYGPSSPPPAPVFDAGGQLYQKGYVALPGGGTPPTAWTPPLGAGGSTSVAALPAPTPVFSVAIPPRVT